MAQQDPSKIQKILPLLESTQEGALATLEQGRPFVTLIGFLYEKDSTGKGLGGFYFLMSDLARHTRHLKACPEASLLVVSKSGPASPYEKERATILGKVAIVENAGRLDALKKKYLEIFPNAEIFFTLKDFRFYQLMPDEIYWIGGFGKVMSLK